MTSNGQRACSQLRQYANRIEMKGKLIPVFALMLVGCVHRPVKGSIENMAAPGTTVVYPEDMSRYETKTRIGLGYEWTLTPYCVMLSMHEQSIWTIPCLIPAVPIDLALGWRLVIYQGHVLKTAEKGKK